MELSVQEHSFSHIKELVAKVLLEYARNDTTDRRWLTLQDLATIAGTSRGIVHMSLRSLQDDGAIELEHRRIIINKQLLQEVTAAGYIQSKGG